MSRKVMNPGALADATGARVFAKADEAGSTEGSPKSSQNQGVLVVFNGPEGSV